VLKSNSMYAVEPKSSSMGLLFRRVTLCRQSQSSTPWSYSSAWTRCTVSPCCRTKVQLRGYSSSRTKCTTFMHHNFSILKSSPCIQVPEGLLFGIGVHKKTLGPIRRAKMAVAFRRGADSIPTADHQTCWLMTLLWNISGNMSLVSAGRIN
jgi:hypothetical protein